MTGWIFSRIRLRQAPAVAALLPVIMPKSAEDRARSGHHWVWSLFADGPDRARDFLWRRDTDPRQGECIFTLSARPPLDPFGLFEIDSKPFEPTLAVGDRLRFRLRVVPAASRPGAAGSARGVRYNPVQTALAALTPEERRHRRATVIPTVLGDWLAKQGAKSGFTLQRDPLLTVLADDWVRLPRDGAAPMDFLAVDVDGGLTVTDPAAFVGKLLQGFGRSRAFGCGLMLIRRG